MTSISDIIISTAVDGTFNYNKFRQITCMHQKKIELILLKATVKVSSYLTWRLCYHNVEEKKTSWNLVFGPEITPV